MPSSSPVLTQSLGSRAEATPSGRGLALAGGSAKAAALTAAREPARASTDKRCARVIGVAQHITQTFRRQRKGCADGRIALRHSARNPLVRALLVERCM